MPNEGCRTDTYRKGIETLRNRTIYLPDNVNVHFHFSEHSSEDELGSPGRLQLLFKKADIYFPESMLSESDEEIEDGLGTLNNIAKGREKEYESQISHLGSLEYGGVDPVTDRGRGFMRGIFRALYASHVVVGIIDTGREPGLGKQAHDILQHDLTTQRDRTVEEFIEETLEVAVDMSNIHTYRELYMLANIGPSTEHIVASNPRLSKKSKINVLLTLGTTHTYPYVELARRYGTERVTRSFGLEKPVVFSPRNQLGRAAQFGVELDDSTKRDLAAKAGFTNSIREIIANYPHSTGCFDRLNSSQRQRIINDICRGLTVEEYVALVKKIDTSADSSDESPDHLDTVASKWINRITDAIIRTELQAQRR